MADILVVGALHHDVIVTAPRLPMLDETLKGSGVAYALGGKGGNQALAAARHGASVAFAGRVGADEAGRAMREALSAGGVDVAQISTDAQQASGMSVAIVTANGDYGAVIVSGANEAIDGAAIQIPEGLQLLVLQNEVLPEVNLATARKASKAGAKVMLNAAPARALDPALLELLDVIIVNRVEAAAIDGILPRENITLIETRGGEGLRVLRTADDAFALPAFPVDVISSHGAGDCFVGALAARLCAGDTLEPALTYAAAAAALHVSAPVQNRSAITPADVFALMETRHADGH